MKLVQCLALLGFLSSFTLRSSASDPAPVRFRFSVVQQFSEGPVLFKTNVTAKATNTVSSAKYATSNYVLDSARLLKMLANSYNTNFPPSAELKMFGRGGIAVMDGSNILLAPAIMSINFSNVWTISGTQVIGHFSSQKGNETRSTADMIQTFPTAFVYDDTGLATKDGSTTVLFVPGIESIKFHSLQVNIPFKNNSSDVKFTGAGYGTIFNGASSNRFTLSGDASAVINSHQ